MTALRRAGSPWRILAHEWAGKGAPTLYGVSYSVDNADDGQPQWQHDDDTWTVHAPGTELDEVVVGRWLHFEQLGPGRWSANVGGVHLEITVDRDGRPVAINVYGPGDWDQPAEGCTYECTWTDPPSTVGGQ